MSKEQSRLEESGQVGSPRHSRPHLHSWPVEKTQLVEEKKTRLVEENTPPVEVVEMHDKTALVGLAGWAALVVKGVLEALVGCRACQGCSRSQYDGSRFGNPTWSPCSCCQGRLGLTSLHRIGCL